MFFINKKNIADFNKFKNINNREIKQIDLSKKRNRVISNFLLIFS